MFGVSIWFVIAVVVGIIVAWGVVWYAVSSALQRQKSAGGTRSGITDERRP